MGSFEASSNRVIYRSKCGLMTSRVKNIAYEITNVLEKNSTLVRRKIRLLA